MYILQLPIIIITLYQLPRFHVSFRLNHILVYFSYFLAYCMSKLKRKACNTVSHRIYTASKTISLLMVLLTVYLKAM